MITEDRVTFEIAKLLRDKGFDEPCDYIYDEDNLKWVYHAFIFLSDGGLATNSKLKDISREIVTAPTIQMVMKWLREVYNIDITITPDYKENYTTMIFVNRELPFTEIGSFKIYKAACEAAIKYALENLI